MPMPRAGYPGHTPSPGVTPQAPVIGEAPSPPCGLLHVGFFLDAVRVQSHADDSRAGDAHGEASDGGKQFRTSEANSTSTMARGRTVACRASVGVIFSLGMAHSQGPYERPSRLARLPGSQQHQMLIAAAGEVTDAGVANLGCRHQFFRRRIVRTQEVSVPLTSAGAFLLTPARRPRLLQHETQAFRMHARYRARYFL